MVFDQLIQTEQNISLRKETCLWWIEPRDCSNTIDLNDLGIKHYFIQDKTITLNFNRDVLKNVGPIDELHREDWTLRLYDYYFLNVSVICNLK